MRSELCEEKQIVKEAYGKQYTRRTKFQAVSYVSILLRIAHLNRLSGTHSLRSCALLQYAKFLRRSNSTDGEDVEIFIYVQIAK